MRIKGRRLSWREVQNGPSYTGDLVTYYMVVRDERYAVATLRSPDPVAGALLPDFPAARIRAVGGAGGIVRRCAGVALRAALMEQGAPDLAAAFGIVRRPVCDAISAQFATSPATPKAQQHRYADEAAKGAHNEGCGKGGIGVHGVSEVTEPKCYTQSCADAPSCCWP